MAIDTAVDILQIYGLSPTQARVFIHLAGSGPIGAGDLARKLRMNRMKVYRTLKCLQDMGLVEVILGRPMKFVAVPIERALDRMVDSARKKVSEMELNRPKVLEVFSKIHIPSESVFEPKFRIHSGRRSIYNLLFNMFNSARNEVCILTTRNELYRLSFSGLDEVLRRCNSRKVKVRILTKVDERSIDAVENYMKYASIRHTSLPSKMRFVIVDDRDVLTSVLLEDSMSLNTERDVGLWTDSRDYLHAIKAFFDEIWSDSPNADLVIESLKSGRAIEETKILDGIEEYFDTYVRMVAAAKSEVLILTDSLREPALPKIIQILLKELMDRGVDVKLLISIREEELSDVEELHKHVHVKHIEPAPNIQLLVVDRSQCLMRFLSSDQTDSLGFRQNVWSNFLSHSSFMAEVFMEFWSRAVDASSRFRELRFHQTIKRLPNILKRHLEREGWKLELPGKIEGKSGLIQEFDFIIRKMDNPERIVVGDFLVKESYATASVIALYVKSLDVEPDRKILVTPSMEQMSEELLSLIKNYGINLVWGLDAEEVCSSILKNLRR